MPRPSGGDDVVELRVFGFPAEFVEASLAGRETENVRLKGAAVGALSHLPGAIMTKV